MASAVGGIPEVVLDGQTGYLVPYDKNDPSGLEAGLAARTAELLQDTGKARSMGAAGRQRAVKDFGWAAIAHRTIAIYEHVLGAVSLR